MGVDLFLQRNPHGLEYSNMAFSSSWSLVTLYNRHWRAFHICPAIPTGTTTQKSEMTARESKTSPFHAGLYHLIGRLDKVESFYNAHTHSVGFRNQGEWGQVSTESNDLYSTSPREVSCFVFPIRPFATCTLHVHGTDLRFLETLQTSSCE